MAILTDLKARHLKPADNPVSHGGVTGLALHPSSTKGHGKWVLRYISPFTGKRRNTGLGTYPEVSIAEAAQKALLMRQQISAGQDPLEQKKVLEPAQPTVPTFEDAATTVHAERLPGWKNHKHGQQWINTLTQDVFPIIGSLPLDLIQPRHIADALRPTWLEKPETSSRIK
ncbi:tyrosine-type recombinase/integrase, partial [Ferrovum myxofaciens]|uniref:tyrosine-type recombinase/integrase n=1 Tax=Ferrovum myxofaciens TaxID=416213 RepID=UPI0012375E23